MVWYSRRNSHGRRDEGVSLRKYGLQSAVVVTNARAMSSPPQLRHPCITVST